MTDNELLLAISNIVQSQVEPLQKEIQQTRVHLDGKIDQLGQRVDRLEQEVGHLNQEVGHLNQEVGQLSQKVVQLEVDVKQTRIVLENDVFPRVQNIESCYTSTYNRYASGVGQIEEIQTDVDALKKVVADHSEKLQKIS